MKKFIRDTGSLILGVIFLSILSKQVAVIESRVSDKTFNLFGWASFFVGMVISALALMMFEFSSSTQKSEKKSIQIFPTILGIIGAYLIFVGLTISDW